MLKKRSIPFILLFFSVLCCYGQQLENQCFTKSYSFFYKYLFKSAERSGNDRFSSKIKIGHIFICLQRTPKVSIRSFVGEVLTSVMDGPPIFQNESGRPTGSKQSDHTEVSQGQRRFRSVFLLSIPLLGAMTMIMIYMMWCQKKRKQENVSILNIQSEQSDVLAKASQMTNKNHIHLIKLVAHDLRNPIGAMSTIVSMMMEKKLPEDLHELVRLMEMSVQSSLDLVNGLLDVDFDEQQDLRLEEIRLDDLLEPCLRLLKLKAKAKCQQLVYHNKLQLSVWADKEKIWRVINNLIGNAIKFSPEGGYIHIITQREISGIVISILDQGIGIPATLQNEIFQPFSPAKRSGTKGEKPFGLGLYISKQIMEAHQGRIWFKSECDLGTEFFIELPFHN